MKDREVLLRYVRMYSKDETVLWLKQELKKAETEIGIVRSERDEAIEKLSVCEAFKFALSEQVTTAEERKLLRKQYTQDLYVSNLKEEISKLRRQRKMLKIDVDRWRNKYFDKVAKKNNGRPLAESRLPSASMVDANYLEAWIIKRINQHLSKPVTNQTSEIIQGVRVSTYKQVLALLRCRTEIKNPDQ